VHLDRTRIAKAATTQQAVAFTPAVQAELPADGKGVRAGIVVGALDVSGSGGALTPGRYDVYVWHATSGWTTVLARDGKIVLRSNDVVLDEYPPPGQPRYAGKSPHGSPSAHLTGSGLTIVAGTATWELQLTY